MFNTGYSNSTRDVAFGSYHGKYGDTYKQDTHSSDVFQLVSEGLNSEYKAHKGNFLCPNSLSDTNLRLRYNEPLTELDKKIIAEVDKAFEKVDGLEEDKTFYRTLCGINLPDEILEAQAGDTLVPDKGFAQVGVDEQYALKYLPSSEKVIPTLFRMNFKKGDKVSFSKHTGSGYPEGMLNRGEKFKIVSKEYENIPTYYADFRTGAAVQKTNRALVYTLDHVE